MKITALRGVCIGVDRHLKAGDTADLDPAMVTYLVGIGAVERLSEEPVPTGRELAPKSKPIKADLEPQSGESAKKEK